ncbi:MAG: hypothetical protein M3145_07440 [Pseudomonadota bacterium]|nr:hypothetical protein [Pseudomonadota bacterium]
MPRFYFDCSGTHQFLLDTLGSEVADLGEARAHALQVARLVMRTGLFEDDWYDWVVEINDESGEAALLVRFSDAAH